MLSSAQSRFQVPCSIARPLSGANEVGGHDRDKHYLLLTFYSRTLLSLTLYTAAVVSCATRKLKQRKSAGFLALACSSGSVAASCTHLVILLHNRDAATLRYGPASLVQYASRHGPCPVRVTCVSVVCYRCALCGLKIHLHMTTSNSIIIFVG